MQKSDVYMEISRAMLELGAEQVPMLGDPMSTALEKIRYSLRRQADYSLFVDKMNKMRTMEHAVLGLCGEAGEVAEVYKKSVYKLEPVNRDKMVEELGDLYFYLQATASLLGVTMVQLQEINRAKLEARHGKA